MPKVHRNIQNPNLRQRARELRAEAIAESSAQTGRDHSKEGYCTMCGPDFCSMRISRDL